MKEGPLITGMQSRHNKLVSSLIRFLIAKCYAFPIAIETEKKLDLRGKTVSVDVFWNNKYIECVASTHGLFTEEKIKLLVELKVPIYLAIASDISIKSISERVILLIKGVLVFDIEKEQLLRSFDSFDEYLGYMMLGNPWKTLNIDL